MTLEWLCALLGAILIADIIGWWVVPRRLQGLRVGINICLYACYSAAIFLSGNSPLQPVRDPDSGSWQLAATLLVLVWWFLSARMLTELLGAILISRTEGGGRLLREVLGALIFLVATVAAAAYVLELPVKGLLATSGALAIIVGLALQSTLSDVFSGIVLNATRPYQVGDWIQIDGMEGRVTDIDWRATLLLTSQGSTVVIPNSVAAKTKIQNMSRPQDQHGVTISLHLPLRFRPERVQEILEQALLGYSALLPVPAPKVILKNITEGLLEYEVIGFVGTPAEKIAARNRLYDIAYRHLRASGVDIANSAEIPVAGITRFVLDDVRIFASFTSEDKDRLAMNLLSTWLATGDFVLKANAISEYLLVIGSGVVSVQLNDGAHWVEVARMGPGEVLGEEGVMDNKPNGAQFIALSAVKVLQLHRDEVRRCMGERSQLRTSLTRLQMLRQQHARSILMQKAPTAVPGGFLKWLRHH
ncbi:mechanosensitive ion channel family protein [Pseudomonas sp. R2-60-08W]|uniref:mechanosensitive ion channel family protein n=1 Tax=Pseudomonas sp. R2-60-08W TaxID=1173280 RepID=UPI000F6B9C8C|nr:mechanosensitive ion channel family protein [Pseudomonas sp. R2-60-08W]AZF26806.1 cAMP-binding protein [Pseudomonas sp. R2-60-08W]